MKCYETHALNEFRAAGWIDENGKYCDEMQQLLCEGVIRLLKTFSDEGHSGSSSPYAINIFKRLANFEPIAPLTGEDWEWEEVSEGFFQNKRFSSVFKKKEGAYWNDGKIFWEWFKDENGKMIKSYFTSKDSFVYITFPFKKPEPEYVFVPTEEFPYKENIYDNRTK
jgi:hypothetical protein